MGLQELYYILSVYVGGALCFFYKVGLLLIKKNKFTWVRTWVDGFLRRMNRSEWTWGANDTFLR